MSDSFFEKTYFLNQMIESLFEKFDPLVVVLTLMGVIALLATASVFIGFVKKGERFHRKYIVPILASIAFIILLILFLVWITGGKWSCFSENVWV